MGTLHPTSQRPAADRQSAPRPCGHSRASVRRRHDSGTVLIVTMWIVLVLAGLVLVFARRVRVEAVASANQVASLQALATVRGAVQFVLANLDGTDGTAPSEADTPCEAVQVGSGLFWVLRAGLEDDSTYCFGIVDEASKINLNSATSEMLLKLPGMTAELAASIVDWRDADSDVSPGGAEGEYYLLLSDPYYCKNAPFETVEEILLVKGATQQLLYGEDANRNGLLDPNENDAADSYPPDNRDGHLDRGFLDCVTVYSIEPNAAGSGEPRADVNEVAGEALSNLLRSAVSQDRFFQVMGRVRSGRPFRNILDFYLRTGLTTAEFAQIADQLTTRREETLVGLVNVNTAPREVLLCLPGLDESDVIALLSRRASTDTDLSSIAWVADALPREKAVAAGDHITTRSFQFSADIVSVSGNGRAFKRCRAVVNARNSPPRLLHWSDLTHLGWPLAPEVVSTLRAGTDLSEVTLSMGKEGY